ncbi:tripartite tricarboxylate transporter substrate binding protein [Roseomonas terrae]|jgi:tripartite-type tricarboxylate transporter receptor subunit TctC|uniref:Tripartite tricarboxylate transporter substrate binding protein n=1 Tax=Neoroseomonas terrae TaxID=424799 RepID=A0ABS5EGD9_9PROT|nr:tripartite tricarboxylate transporter substrate binding protein [Neoroseomonas terrae]MBR0650084.1 tripartite tricarboxylate transporter substrate binding protein [Neoroseomonas terrae]
MTVAYAVRRTILGLTLVAPALLPLGGTPASAQPAWPSRPVRVIVSYAPGGGADIMARLVAEPLARALGQPVVVENRAGAGGAIGTEACARAAPDGYTLCFGSIATHSIIPYMQSNLSWDPLRDFTPITNLAYYPTVLAVNPSVPARTMDELIAWLKAHPGTAYGTSGVGSSNHLTGEVLSRTFGLGLVHVPYRGGNQAQADAIAGQIPMVLDQITAMVPQIQAGNLRPLLLVGGDQRSPLLPDVPTITERLMPDFRIQGYQGIFAPAGLPEPILRRLNAAIRTAVEGSDVSQKLIDMGSEVVLSTPEAFATYLRDTAPMYREVVASSGARVE